MTQIWTWRDEKSPFQHDARTGLRSRCQNANREHVWAIIFFNGTQRSVTSTVDMQLLLLPHRHHRRHRQPLPQRHCKVQGCNSEACVVADSSVVFELACRTWEPVRYIRLHQNNDVRGGEQGCRHCMDLVRSKSLPVRVPVRVPVRNKQVPNIRCSGADARCNAPALDVRSNHRHHRMCEDLCSHERRQPLRLDCPSGQCYQSPEFQRRSVR